MLKYFLIEINLSFQLNYKTASCILLLLLLPFFYVGVVLLLHEPRVVQYLCMLLYFLIFSKRATFRFKLPERALKMVLFKYLKNPVKAVSALSSEHHISRTAQQIVKMSTTHIFFFYKLSNSNHYNRFSSFFESTVFWFLKLWGFMYLNLSTWGVKDSTIAVNMECYH